MPDAPAPAPTPPILALTILDKLSARELEVAYLLVRGQTCREIATALGISIKTIDTHRAHVLKKLALRNNVALTRFMIRHGFVTP